MKIIKSSIFVLFALFSFSTSATINSDTQPPLEEQQQVRAEVLKHIKDTPVKKLHGQALIKFIVNSKNEIVVLNVRSDHRNIEQIVKDQLNYKRIRTRPAKKNQIYLIDITFDVG